MPGKKESSPAFINPTLTPWLLISEVYWLANKLFERRLSSLRVTPPMARLLSVLYSATEPVKPHEIAELLLHDTPSIGAMLYRTEGRDFIRRTKHPTDNRAVAVELTAEGARVAAQVDEISASLYEELFAGVLSRASRSAMEDGLRSVREHVFGLPETDFRLRRAQRWPVWRA
jgi:DNA-binding MarR family transcriptional regulator